MRITVVALGKIGLPLAVQFAERGHQVTGCDVNPSVVEQVARGVAPFPGEAHLAEKLSEVTTRGHLTATTDTVAAVRDSEAVVVVVPLFVNQSGEPDFAWMDSATAPGNATASHRQLPTMIPSARNRPLVVVKVYTCPLNCPRSTWRILRGAISRASRNSPCPRLSG